MIKRITLLFILLCSSQMVFAGFWGNASSCSSDICNCGDNNKRVYETWDGNTTYKGKRHRNCPPYNIQSGRNDNTCIVKKGLPKDGISYYENLCGESIPSSSYFQPQIRLRGQQCNAAACWTTSDIMLQHGWCVVLAGGYGFPLHRMCTRIALPEDTINNIDADPGYTQGQHINFEGATKNDEPVYGPNGEILDVDLPKLCLYKDPSFISISGGHDVLDVSPFNQPFHKTTGVHPVIQVLKFFVTASSTLAKSPYQLLQALFDLIDSKAESGTPIGEELSDSMEAIMDVYDIVGDQMFSVLDQVGQINRVVDNDIYGCVNIPLGPYPPPFCPTVAPFEQTATVHNICPKDSSGNIISSTRSSPCVVSTVTNNFVNNSARIGFETLVPLCRAGQDPMTTDSCVTIENMGAFSTASAMHAGSAYKDLIPHCDNAPTGAPCINTMLPHACSIKNNGCNNGFRVIYGTQLGDALTPQSYFYNDLTDCTGVEPLCQKIWGVNLGEFIDIELEFPTVQNPSMISPISKTFSLTDKNSKTMDFTASIVRISSFDSIHSFTQEPNQLCVVDDNSVIGCSTRIQPLSVQIHQCGSGFAGINCTSSYFEPQFIAAYSEDGHVTASLVEPLTVFNSGTSNLNTSINLAGVSFESFVTDDTFIAKPFSGTNSPNPASIFGTYRDGEKPIDGDDVNEYAVYLTGLEYINGEYHVGGSYACLEQANTTKCPDNMKACVLAKLLESDTVACSDLINKAAIYGSLGTCPSDTSSCTVTDSLAKLDGSTMNILDCSTTDGENICYDSGGVELCKISQTPEDRESPDSSLGATLADDEYYDPGGTTPGNYSVNYDTNEFGLRSKTSIELGLCVAIPQGVCAEQNDYSQENGYAYWPETPLGEVATGTCQSGWSLPTAPLERRCVPDPDTKTFKFEPVYDTDSSGNRTYKIQCTAPPSQTP